MIRYKKRQNKMKNSAAFGKWYAHAQASETIDIAKLAAHMASHNSPYSPGVIKGLLTDMVDCIKELLLDGKNVKLDDLAIFYLTIVNSKGGAATAEAFTTSANVEGVRMRCRATGNLAFTNLNLDAQLKEADTYTGGGTATDGGTGGTGSGTDGEEGA